METGPVPARTVAARGFLADPVDPEVRADLEAADPVAVLAVLADSVVLAVPAVAREGSADPVDLAVREDSAVRVDHASVADGRADPTLWLSATAAEILAAHTTGIFFWASTTRCGMRRPSRSPAPS